MGPDLLTTGAPELLFTLSFSAFNWSLSLLTPLVEGTVSNCSCKAAFVASKLRDAKKAAFLTWVK